MFHDRHRGRVPDGTLIESDGAISQSPTSVVVLDKHLNHFNVHALDDGPDGGPLAQRPAGARRSARRTASR